MPIEIIKTNDCRESRQCIQFNECDFTISTNNHNIVGFFIRRSCFVAISLLFYARDFHSFIHSTAQTMTKRAEWICVCESENKSESWRIVSVIGWMVVTILQQCDKDN